MSRRGRREHLREQGLNPRVLSSSVAAAYLRPLTGDVREHVGRWCAASGRPEADTVTFVGPRAELLRFFAAEGLPATDRPVVVVVNGEALGGIFADAGQPHFARIHAGLATPARHGELRVLVCNNVGLTLVRVHATGGAT